MLLSTRKLQNIKIFAVINRAAVNKKRQEYQQRNNHFCKNYPQAVYNFVNKMLIVDNFVKILVDNINIKKLIAKNSQNKKD